MGMPSGHHIHNSCASVGNAAAEKSETKAEGVLEVTSNAAKKILEFAKKEDKEGWLVRVKIMPGGCSGFTYVLWFEKKAEANDLVIEKNGAKVCVDQESWAMLQGSVLEYLESLQGSGFAVQNPNVHGGCGCGKSFS